MKECEECFGAANGDCDNCPYNVKDRVLDCVEFIEKILDIKLLAYQKRLIKSMMCMKKKEENN